MARLLALGAPFFLFPQGGGRTEQKIKMASPQKENGFTPIANEILEALAATRISGETRQVIDHIIRKTYGYGKKEDRIALSQFVLATKLKKPEVCRALRKAKEMNLIIGKNANEKGVLYRFNKDFTAWKSLAKKQIVGNIANKSLAKMPHTKEIYTKEIIHATPSVAVVKPLKPKKEPKPVLIYTPEMLEDRLVMMEAKEGSYLDIIATYIREKPVRIENSKQLSLTISRFARIAKAAEGAYTVQQIMDGIDAIKKDNQDRERRGQPTIDWTIETIIKTLIKK